MIAIPAGYREVEAQVHAAVQKMAAHKRDCAQCDLGRPGDCKMFNRLIRRVDEASAGMNPEWLSWVEEFLPHQLPVGWQLVGGGVGGSEYRWLVPDIAVIVSGAWEQDDLRWLHVSASTRSRRLPRWDEMTEIKGIFIGPHRTAYQVFPPKDRYVNLHECLHLWTCLDRDEYLPDFTRGGISI